MEDFRAWAVKVVIAVAFVAACSSPSIGDEISELESAIVMPEGAYTLDAYARFYTISEHTIEGEYVSRDMLSFLLEHRVVRERLADNVFLVDADQMPGVRDGGCGVLTLSYSRQTHELHGPDCNGMA